MDKRPVAVFDIDGTVFRSSLLIELIEALIEKGIIVPDARTSYQGAWDNWLNRRGEYETFIRGVVEGFRAHIKGVPYAEVADAAGEIIEAQKGRVYCFTRDLIREYKSKGFYLLAVSHSPKLIVDGFAHELGFHKSYGVFYETGPSDRFTGVVTDEHLIGNKAAILKRMLEKERLSLHGSVGVGDTESDISMLSLVETPIAFNPNRLLYRHALQNNWKVVVERKDVIYEL